MIKTPALFLQSEVQNPFAIYSEMLQQHPVYFDSANKLWIVYSYAACKALLFHPDAHIPVPGSEGLNECALKVMNGLARLSNPPRHMDARQLVMRLMHNRQTVNIPVLLDELLPAPGFTSETDWVQAVCKRLPVLEVLKSFSFSEDDSSFIVQHIEQLVTIMRPVKTKEQVAVLNEIIPAFYRLTEQRLLSNGWFKEAGEEQLAIGVANIIGLMIQSYDAGRGLLTNALQQLLNQQKSLPAGRPGIAFYGQLVTETMRFDSPIHNTRRVATADICIERNTIKKGQEILIVLAAANRDPKQFKDPGIFNIYRANNYEHLGFGVGIHQCPAHNSFVHLAAATLHYLFKRFRKIEITGNNPRYEPLANARLLVSMPVTLS